MSPNPRKLVVAALVRDGHGRFLLTRRRADQPMPDLWELPGGKIEAGESPVAALEREIAEELDCPVVVHRIFDVLFHAYPEFDLLLLVYACELSGPPRAVEVAEIGWVAPSELDHYAVLPADRPLIERLIREAEGVKGVNG